MKKTILPFAAARLLIGFAASVFLVGSISEGRTSDNLIDDRFADAERSTQKPPESVRWFLHATSPAYSSSIGDSVWTLQAPPPPARIGALSHLPAPETLKAGESLIASIILAPGEPPARWGIGLFDSRGSRLSADVAGSAGGDYRGFVGQCSPANGEISLASRSRAEKDLWSPKAFQELTSAPLATAASPRRATLTVSKTPSGDLLVSLEIDGAKCSAKSSNGPDRFDTVAIVFEGTGGSSAIHAVSLEKVSTARVLAETAESKSIGMQALRALPTGSRWYLQSSQTSPGQDWNTVSTWFSATAGGGTNPMAISSTDVFDLNRRRVISPAVTSGTTTFGGGALVMGVSSTISMIGSNTTTTAIPFLVSTGGMITNSGGSSQNLTIGELEMASGGMILSTGASSRTLVLTSSTLTGSGTLTFGGGGKHQLQVTNGHNFSGELTLSTGTMTFLNNFTTSGPLVVKDTCRVALTRAISCSSLTISGPSIAPRAGDAPGSYTFTPGTYSYATLNAQYPSIFVGGTTGGSITVRSGTTYYLRVDQAQGRGWTSAHASDWNTSPTGGGSNAPAVAAMDDYSTNGRLLRTPATSDTFAGKTLLLQNGAIALKNPRPEVATVPTLIATSGTIMQYLNTSGTASLKVNFFTQNPGTTNLVATVGQTLDLNVDYLSGSGNFSFTTAGQSLLTVSDASQYSGTYTQASGTLRLSPITSGPVYAINSPFAMKGRLVVNTGATVVLNRDTFVGGLTVNGTVHANGTYSAASLGFTGTASITVVTPDLATPTALFGVNVACGTFTAGGGMMPTNPVIWDYYASKGLTLIRVPFLWQHLQTTLNGPLNTSMLNKFDTILSIANARGMKVILDMHNYGCYTGTTHIIGTPAAPYSAYQDVWTKVGAHFANHPNKPALFGYDIMNEPTAVGTNWPAVAKYAIAGIRANDMTTYIVAEGTYAAGAQRWHLDNANTGFIDPACRVIYSAHSYWGTQHNDLYASYDDEDGYENMGVDQLRPFVDWIRKRKFAGFIGEYGVPTNTASPDARWHTVLDRALSYMEANGVSGTYWSGGPGWEANYELLSDVFILPGPSIDAPAMSILQNYSQ